MRRLYFWWRRYWDGDPCREEMAYLWHKYQPTTIRRMHEMTRDYIYGATLEEIATKHKVTRERVRQCIWKVWRQSKKPTI
jgi:hypothetical protein